MKIKVENFREVLIMGPGNVALSPSCEREFDWGEDKVLVKTHFSAISAGSEYANVIGDKNIEASKSADEVVLTYPMDIGYASSGIVEKVGKNVANVKVGDRVVPLYKGHASHHVCDAGNIIKIPYDDISLEEMAALYISTFSLSGARKLRIEVGESCAIMGCGFLGLYSVMFCKLMGATPIIAVDPVPEKREKALALGADFAVDPFEEGFVEKTKALTDGRGVNAAVEVTGKGSGLDMILDCMARHGRISLLGCTRNSDFTIDYYRKIHYTGVELIGAHTGTRPTSDSRPGFWTIKDDCDAIMRLLHYKKIDFKKMISDIRPASEAHEIYDRLANDYSNFPGGMILDWRNV